MYTVEVSSKELRGSFSIFEGVSRSLGLILVYGFGALLPWYQIAYFAPVLPITAFLCLLNSPESPVYLLQKGRHKEAEMALEKLQNDKKDIIEEMLIISESLVEKQKANYGTLTEKSSAPDGYPEIKKPFAIVMMLALVQQFSGASVIRGYVVKIFGKVFLKQGEYHYANNHTHLCNNDHVHTVSQSANVAAILIALVRFVSSLTLAKLLVKFRRRTLYSLSAVATVLSLILFATTLYISDHVHLWHREHEEDILNWLSVVAACLIVFSSNLGIQPMPMLMSSELFPSEVRALCKVLETSFVKVNIYIVGNLPSSDLPADSLIAQVFPLFREAHCSVWYFLPLQCSSSSFVSHHFVFFTRN